VFLRDGFRAAGAGQDGVVRLPGAHIGGQLDCTGGELTSADGPALVADGLQADGGVFLRGGFRAAGAGELGVVRLAGAHIGGQLGCAGGRTRHGGGGLDLDLYQCQIGQLLLGRGFAARPDARGLRYGGIPDGPSVDDWLGWFRDPGPGLGYDAQPYQQLAAAHRAAGSPTSPSGWRPPSIDRAGQVAGDLEAARRRAEHAETDRDTARAQAAQLGAQSDAPRPGPIGGSRRSRLGCSGRRSRP